MNKKQFHTVGVEGDDVGGVEDLHSEPLLGGVVVTLDADSSKPRVLQSPLKKGGRRRGS